MPAFKPMPTFNVDLGDGWAMLVAKIDGDAVYGPCAGFEECRRYITDDEAAKIESAIRQRWPAAPIVRFRR